MAADSEWQRAQAACGVLVDKLLHDASPDDVLALLLVAMPPPVLLPHLQRAQAMLRIRQGRPVVLS